MNKDNNQLRDGELANFRMWMKALKLADHSLSFTLPLHESQVGSDAWNLHIAILKIEDKYDPKRNESQEANDDS